MIRTADESRAKLYEKAATMAQETITLVRTIISFGTYQPELVRCERSAFRFYNWRWWY